MKPSVRLVDVDRTETWTRWRRGLCEGCWAGCCTMPVEATLADLVRLGLVEAFEAEHEAPRRIARRLEKGGSVARYNAKSGLFTLASAASGDCLFLHPATRRCTVYDRRPETCRNHPRIGPRPGWCAWAPRAD